MHRCHQTKHRNNHDEESGQPVDFRQCYEREPDGDHGERGAQRAPDGAVADGGRESSASDGRSDGKRDHPRSSRKDRISKRGSKPTKARAIANATTVATTASKVSAISMALGKPGANTAPESVMALPSMSSPMTCAKRLRWRTTIIMLVKMA